MRLSKPQREIIDKITAHATPDELEQHGGRLFSIPAVAGAGKSMLIVELARRDSQRNILFLCKSRNIADRAQSSLPGNVTAQTFTDAAMKFLRQARPGKAQSKLVKHHTTQDILQVAPNGTTQAEAKRALGVLARFYDSAHPHPQEAHLPENEDWTRWASDVKAVLGAARAAWFAQQREDGESVLPFSLNGLMKWWMTSQTQNVQHPELGKRTTVSPIPSKYELIIIEEAQLLSAGLLDFLSRQRASIVFFGDGYQALQPGANDLHHQKHPIYERAESIRLNESFRFGPAIATICSAMANKAGAPSREWVKGLGQSAVYPERRRFEWESLGQHYVFLASSAVTLFQEALEATRRGKVVAWINGLDSQPIRLFRDLIVLGMGRDQGYRTNTPRQLIETPWLRNAPSLQAVIERNQSQPYSTISQLALWVNHQAEPELLSVVDRWRKADNARQAQFTRQLNAPLHRDLTLGTVYQAQGHEWPRVALSDDLFPMSLCGHDWYAGKHGVRSVHQAYTGASRAQRGLALPSMFLAHLQTHGWDLPKQDMDVEIDLEPEQGRQASRSIHTHFGMDRHARLELTPETRKAVRKRHVTAKASTRPSGQTLIKEHIEREASSSPAAGPEDLFAALGRKRRRQQP